MTTRARVSGIGSHLPPRVVTNDDLAGMTRQADILIAAIGRAAMVSADMVKEGVVVVDVGINRVPDPAAKRLHWAPNDVMLHFFEQIESQPDKQDVRYVLALLLVRRRVMRLEESRADAEGHEVMVLYCPRRETTYEVPTAVPEQTRIEQIQEELARLLE